MLIKKLLLLFTMVFSLCLCIPQGSGTQENPYLMSNFNDLLWLSTTPGVWDDGAYFVQTANINAASSAILNNGKGFKPIGNANVKFNGKYDGRSKEIKNLFINRETESYIALWGYTTSATWIKNVKLVNATIRGGTEYVAALIARSNGFVFNCYASGSVRGGNNSGGLIAHKENGNIENCINRASVQGRNNTGGIAGLTNQRVNIKNCKNYASVYGSFYVGGLVGRNDAKINCSNNWGSIYVVVDRGENIGGLVGYNEGYGTITNSANYGSVLGQGSHVNYCGGLIGRNNAHIKNCYSTGNVRGSYEIGGFIGSLGGGSVMNCYALGNVEGISLIAGFIGKIDNTPPVIYCYSKGTISGGSRQGFIGYSHSATVYGCYFDKTTAGTSSSYGGTGLTTAQMKNRNTFVNAGWDLAYESNNGEEDFWNITSSVNSGYPYFFEGVLNTNFSADSTFVNAGVAINFCSNCTSNVLEYKWDFENDGVIDSTERNPSHVYTNNGVYSVKLFTKSLSKVDSLLKQNYITVEDSIQIIPPANPQSVNVNINYPNATISWSSVTTDANSNPISVDGYMVLYSENGGDEFFFHGYTTETTYTHNDVAEYSKNMMYRVVAVKNITSEQQQFLSNLNIIKNKVSYNWLKKALKN